MAEINDKIEVKESRGGKVEIKYFKKYELIGTHTARRTGATLMYLAGIPIYDIMRVTGHKSDDPPESTPTRSRTRRPSSCRSVS